MSTSSRISRSRRRSLLLVLRSLTTITRASTDLSAGSVEAAPATGGVSTTIQSDDERPSSIRSSPAGQRRVDRSLGAGHGQELEPGVLADPCPGEAGLGRSARRRADSRDLSKTPKAFSAPRVAKSRSTTEHDAPASRVACASPVATAVLPSPREGLVSATARVVRGPAPLLLRGRPGRRISSWDLQAPEHVAHHAPGPVTAGRNARPPPSRGQPHEYREARRSRAGRFRRRSERGRGLRAGRPSYRRC